MKQAHKPLQQDEIKFIRDCRKKGLSLRDIQSVTNNEISLTAIYKYTKGI